MNELAGYLLFQSANRNDRQVWIGRSHSLPQLRAGRVGSRLSHNDDVMQEMRARRDLFEFAARGEIMLGFRQKIERINRLVEAVSQIANVFGDTDNFVLALRADTFAAEVLSNRIVILEKFPRKRLD